MAVHERNREYRFEKFAAVLIALTTIFTSTAAFLEQLSSSESERFDRIAQDLSIRATTEQISGALRFSYDWQGAFQTWYELDLLITNAEQLGLSERADIYRTTRDQIVQFSPLLQPPYRDPGSRWADAGKYTADLYLVEAVRLREQAHDKAEVSNTWDQISNYFVLQLTFYAVALSLLGLSTTVQSFTRWLFVFLAGTIVATNIVWGAYLIFIPVDEIPEQAIEAYAEGVGLAYRVQHQEAVEAFSRALDIRPGYANALYDRGFSRLVLGDYDGAVADFEGTLASGRRDTSVLWNMGWAYYLLGRFDEAVAVNQQALQMDPSLIGIRMNQGLTMLAQGRPGNAAAEYDIALQEAARQVQEARSAGTAPPSSLWVYLDAGVADLESLMDVVNATEKPWTQAPALELIRGSRDQVVAGAEVQIRRIKEYAVALEFSGTIPQGSSNAGASAFTFVQAVYDESGNIVDYEDASVNPYNTNQIGILFDFSGIEVGQQEVWKVYLNGREDTALRVINTWSLPSGSSAIKWISYAFSNVYVFAPGEYTVELYIDSKFIQSGTFTVLDPE